MLPCTPRRRHGIHAPYTKLKPAAATQEPMVRRCRHAALHGLRPPQHCGAGTTLFRPTLRSTAALAGEPDRSQTKSHTPVGRRRVGLPDHPLAPHIAGIGPKTATRLAALAVCWPATLVRQFTPRDLPSTTPFLLASMPWCRVLRPATIVATVAALPWPFASRAIPTSRLLELRSRTFTRDGCGNQKQIFSPASVLPPTGLAEVPGTGLYPLGCHPGGQWVGQGETLYGPAAGPLDRKWLEGPQLLRCRSSQIGRLLPAVWASPGPSRDRATGGAGWQRCCRPPAPWGDPLPACPGQRVRVDRSPAGLAGNPCAHRPAAKAMGQPRPPVACLRLSWLLLAVLNLALQRRSRRTRSRPSHPAPGVLPASQGSLVAAFLDLPSSFRSHRGQQRVLAEIPRRPPSGAGHGPFACERRPSRCWAAGKTRGGAGIRWPCSSAIEGVARVP